MAETELRETLVRAGVAEHIADGVVAAYEAQRVTAMSVHYMWDCHVFTRLHGTLDEMVEQATKCHEQDGYGMLCSPILLNAAGKEVRRVGSGLFHGNGHAHGRGRDNTEHWRAECAKWKAACLADPDVVRLAETVNALSERVASDGGTE